MKVTLKDIAQRAGVSVNTVSLALRDMPSVKKGTRESIFKMAEEMGYFDQKGHMETQNICLISTGQRLRDSYFYMSFQQHILSRVHDYNYNMLVYKSTSCDCSQSELQRNFEANSVSGIIILGDMEERIVEKIALCKIPVVAMSTSYRDAPVCTICEDNLAGAYQAVSYLYHRGYREIGFVGSPRHSTGFMERYQGFVGALAEFELYHNPEKQVTTMCKDDVYDYDYLEKALRRMKKLPQAFVCANDNMAMITTKVLYAMELKIPMDVALIGFDNSGVGKMAIPTLTTIDVRCSLQAEIGVRKLVEFIRSETYEPIRLILPIKLVEGNSVSYQQMDDHVI